jgi:ankyrin repeat protein
VTGRVVKAVLSPRAEDLLDLLRERPEWARERFEREFLVEAIPHQLYRDDTPLHLAAAAARPEAARALLEAGADSNAANRLGARPLHYACDPRPAYAQTWRPEDQDAVIRLLLTHGADIDAADKMGITALHRATRARSPGAVRALLEASADVRKRAGKAGSTPLHVAVSSTGASGTAGSTVLQVEIIQLLVNHGASMGDRDALGKTAADRIRSAGLRRSLTGLGLLD